MHVGAIYLHPDGTGVDPDAANASAVEETAIHGGNWIIDNKGSAWAAFGGSKVGAPVSIVVTPRQV